MKSLFRFEFSSGVQYFCNFWLLICLYIQTWNYCYRVLYNVIFDGFRSCIWLFSQHIQLGKYYWFNTQQIYNVPWVLWWHSWFCFIFDVNKFSSIVIISNFWIPTRFSTNRFPTRILLSSLYEIDHLENLVRKINFVTFCSCIIANLMEIDATVVQMRGEAL